MKSKKTLFFISVTGILLVMFAVIVGSQSNLSLAGVVGFGGINENSLILSSDNPIVNSQVKTTKGSTIWAKGDAGSGVTWNNGNNKIAIEQGGYIQTLTIIHGINQVSIDMASGSLSLYHSWNEPVELSTTMYGEDYTFNVSGTYSFTEHYPNRIRIRANTDSIINSITIRYDCVSGDNDQTLETLDDGLENSYIDAGSLKQYATTGFVSGEGNVYGESKRALKLSFNGTTNNFVSLNLSHNVNAGLMDANPDFSKSTITIKAKFSNDISDYGMTIWPMGSTWKHPGYQNMNRSYSSEDGWYSYSLDMSNLDYEGKTSSIRLYISPNGINSVNKATAYVLLDEITYHLTSKSSLVRKETLKDGLENMAHDTNWENCYVNFNNQTTYGRKSASSLEVKPNKSSKDGTFNWFTMFSPQSENYGANRYSLDMSSGLLTMQYKPINISNPSSLTLIVFKAWGDANRAVIPVTSTALKDGWYHFEYNLSNTGLGSASYIRFGFGFDVESTNLSRAIIYFDNIKINDVIQEDYTLGWENMNRDTGWETCNASVNTGYKASDTSINSMKVSFNGKTFDNTNKACFIMSPQSQGIHSNLNFTSGKLTAKFLFSSDIVDKTIRLILTSNNWKTIRYDFNPTSIGNGWYLLSVDFSNMPSPAVDEPNYTGTSIIRVGFGFHGITNSNKSTATIWIDDVFFNNNSNINTATSATIWEAYDTENILQSESVISGRNVTSNNPLEFSGLRNEVSSTQLMVKANTTISSYSLKMGSMYCSSGSHINPEDFSVYVEKYIYIDNSSIEKDNSSYGWKGVGYYPDALVPIDRIITASENNITSGNEQGIWIDLKINKNLKAGTYTGNAVLTLNGVNYNVPLKATVYNAIMSETNHNRSSFAIYNDAFEKTYGEGSGSNTEKTRRAYYDFLLDYRVNGREIADLNSISDYTQFAEAFANEVAFNERISTYRLPVEGNGSDQYDKIYGYLNALITKNLELADEGYDVNFFDKIIFWINDEPDQPASKTSTVPESWNECKQTQTNFHNAISSLKSRLDGYPQLKASFIDIRNVLPHGCLYERISGGSYKSGLSTKYYPNMFNDTYMDTPCVVFDKLNNASERNAYLSTFDHLWFYGCVVPTLPYPGYHIDTKLISQRTIKWMQYAYGIEGEVYWGVNFYMRQDDTHSYTDRDPWTDPYSYEYAAGDGQLVYPGEKYNVVGPLPSMRLASIRNSNQDYEYFYMIDQRINEYNAIHGTNYTSCSQIISSYYSNMFSGTQINASFTTDTFNSYRQALLTIIDELY